MRRNFISEEPGVHIDNVEKKVLLDEDYYGIGAVVDFKEVLVDDGARHANSIHSWREVILNAGAAVGGSIYSEEEILLRSGPGSNSGAPTVVVGDILARNKLYIESSKKKENQSPTIVIGNVYAKDIEIDGQAYFRGNVYATDSIKVKKPTLIAGRLKIGREPFADEKGRRFMIDGSADLQKTTAFGIVCNGNLSVRENVSVLEPLISIRFGDMTMKDQNPIRVISAKCINCIDHDGNPFLCEKFLLGKCRKYDRLVPQDAVRIGERTIVSWYHRASLPMLGQHYMIHALYERALQRPSRSDFRKDGIGASRFEEMPEYLIRNLLQIDISRSATARWFAKKLTEAASMPGQTYYEVLQRWLPGEPTQEELQLKKVKPMMLEEDEVKASFLNDVEKTPQLGEQQENKDTTSTHNSTNRDVA